MHPSRLLTAALSLATGLSVALPGVANAGDRSEGAFHRTNLISDIPGMAAHFDPNLINPWGISAGPTPMWVSDNNAGVTTVYDGAGNALQVGPPAFPAGPLVVNIPKPDGSAGGAPTGTVFNGTTDFNGDRFLFATEDGTLVGWKPTDVEQARVEKDRSTVDAGAVYKGLAIGNNGDGNHLYATNFRFGTIEVFDGNFNLVTLGGSFTDRRIPAGFAPFNIQNLGGQLYVTYAKQKPDKHDDLSGPGNGFVDVYDLNGHLLRRLIRRGALNSPWGLAIAPENFGPFSGDLLVGNFGDGRINAYSPKNGHFRGTLRSETGSPISISGLWGLRFGNGVAGASPNTLYFAAGIVEETHGLFGSITSVGEDDD
jgi:uncharacterized protein (TIGR03118 family)